MQKYHFAVKAPFNAVAEAACGRGRHIVDNVYRVDCLNCQKQDAFILAKDEAESKRHAAFLAQEPRALAEPWKAGNIVCRNCGGERFRVGDRTCYGHYQDYVCADCSHKESRLTETGMSF